MISRSQIEELRDKWQTAEQNIAREYVQHVVLSALYGLRQEVKLAFKGGTALKLLQRSPRFSEDLDFTGWGKGFHLGEWIKMALKEASTAGLDFKTLDSNPTSGGWLALAETRVHDWPIQVEWNISLREKGVAKTETVLVNSPLWVPYSVRALPVDQMAREKIEALCRRKEPRDFFDIYFILRGRLGIKAVAAAKKELIKHTTALNPRSVEKELKQFLPRNHWATAKQLPRMLLQELERL